MLFKRENGLPKGYTLEDGTNISADEAVELWRTAEFVPGTAEEFKVLEEWDEALQESLIMLAVRDKSKRLVGMATIEGDTDHATLSHLAVHPEHRHQGIGQALVKERIRLVDAMGVKRVEVHLMDSNSLKPLYSQLGFQAVNGKDNRLARR